MAYISYSYSGYNAYASMSGLDSNYNGNTRSVTFDLLNSAGRSVDYARISLPNRVSSSSQVALSTNISGTFTIEAAISGITGTSTLYFNTSSFWLGQTVPDPPDPPSIYVTNVTGTSVSLELYSRYADSYDLQYQRSGSSVWEWHPSTGAYPTASGLYAGAYYYFRAKAYEGSVSSAWSREKGVQLKSAPSAPSISVSSISATSISLSLYSSGATSYTLQYREGNGSWMYHPASVSYPTASGLKEGTLYYFRASASNGDGTSGWSSTVSATTKVNISMPTLTIRNILSTSFVVSLSSAGATQYEIQYRTASGGWMSHPAIYSPMTVSGLTPGGKYYVHGRAYKLGTWSSWSGEYLVDLGAARPKNWAWSFTISPGASFYSTISNGAALMRAVEWNDFTDRLVDFRKYKTPTSVPSFTRVSSGSIVTAATINKAINEANVVVSPAIPRVSSGGTVYASTFQLLRDRLNAL